MLKPSQTALSLQLQVHFDKLHNAHALTGTLFDALTLFLV